MTEIEALIQGLIQGFTEFLPISSSGHLSLFQHFSGLSGEGAVSFTIILHLGTLLAVFVAFWKTISALIVEFFSMLGDIFTGKFKWKTMNPNRRFIIMLIVSILPLFIFYIFRNFFAGLASDNDIVVEGVAFLYTSAILFLADKSAHGSKKSGEMTAKNALTIGTFQGIALVPGISRSGSTIAAGMFCGLSREAAVEYSFVLGIPVILAGAVVQLGDLSATAAAIDWLPLAIGFIVSAIAGFFAIKLVKWLVKTDKFKIFAYYTLALGIIVIIVGMIEKFN